MNANALTSRDELNRLNPGKEADYQSRLTPMLDKIQPGDRVLVECHADADGLSGGAIAEYYLEENKPGIEMKKCNGYLNSEEFYEAAQNCDHIIVSDLWIDGRKEHQTIIRRLLAEGINIIIFDHHDKNFGPPPENLGDSYSHTSPETMKKDLTPVDPEKGIGDFLYVSPSRLESPLKNKLTGALITYLMLAPHSKTNLGKILPLLAISISGDYSRADWPKLLAEIGHEDILETLGYALNAGHALKDATRVSTGLKDAGSIEEIVEQEDVKVLLDVLMQIRAEIAKVIGDLDAPFAEHVHILPDVLEAEAFNHPLLVPSPRVGGAYADELRKLIQEKIVVTTQNLGDHLKLDFRSSSSRELHNARRLAGKFGGGGHHEASGAEVPLIEATEEEVLEKLRQVLAQENENFTKITKPEFERVDPELAEHYEHKVRAFIDNIPFGAEILLACHPDMDGAGGAGLIRAFLKIYRPDIRIKSCYDELDTEAFRKAALAHNHIITVDLWIPTTREDQEHLVHLFKNGKKVLIFDHHDDHLEDFNPTKETTEEEHDPKRPETFTDNNPEDICFVSPKRLGVDISHPKDFTATAVAYRILSRIEPSLADNEEAVLLSIFGDRAEGSWPSLLAENERLDEKARLARVINLVKNLRPEHIDEITNAIANGTKTEEMIKTPQIQKLILMRRWIKAKAANITQSNLTETLGIFTHYQITEEDECDFVNSVREQGLEGVLVRHPCLCSGLSFAVAKASPIGGISVVSQIIERKDAEDEEDDQKFEILHSFHTDGQVDVSEFATSFLQGGGKEMAAGGKQKASTREEAQQKINLLKRQLQYLGTGTHP